MNLYMSVTADELELPLCVEDTPKELAARLGLTMNAVRSACDPIRCMKNGKKRGYRIYRVAIDEEPGEENNG